MARVKRGTTKAKRRRNVLKMAKGYRFGRSTKEKQAKEAIRHAGAHAFAHRRRKKGDFRRLFTVRLNAAVRKFDISYSKFIDALNKKEIALDRKILSHLAKENPETFERIVAEVKK
jgi:large subunit ribosomal protein L20